MTQKIEWDDSGLPVLEIRSAGQVTVRLCDDEARYLAEAMEAIGGTPPVSAEAREEDDEPVIFWESDDPNITHVLQISHCYFPLPTDSARAFARAIREKLTERFGDRSICNGKRQTEGASK